MKANQRKKLSSNESAQVKIVGSLVALLLMIIVGVMVYFEAQGSISAFDDSSIEYFTTDADGVTFTVWDGGTSGSNYTGVTIRLEYSASSITNITCYNETGGQETYLETLTTQYTIERNDLGIVAGATTNFTQVNVTYVSNIASGEAGSTEMAVTVFNLLPIIALAVVASVIIGVIIGFGGNKQGL